MSTTTDIRKQGRTFRRVLSERQPLIRNIAATMGDGAGNLKVTGSPRLIWVTINDMPYKAYCTKVDPRYGKHVWLGSTSENGKPSSFYQVLSERAIGSMDSSLMSVGGYAPASRYAWGGEDPLGIDLRAFLPLRIGKKDGGMLAHLDRGFIGNGITRFSILEQNIDVSAHIPTTTGKAAFVLISIDDTGTIIQTKGSEVDIADLDLPDIPSTLAGTIIEPGAVRVYYGQTDVQEGLTNTDFVDLRLSYFLFHQSINLIDGGNASTY